MDTAIDLPAYLRRVGYATAVHNDLATLRGLAAHHAAAIPFENLDPWSGVPARLDLGAVEEKLVAGRRGGYCFEQNALFAAVLTQLDYGVTRLSARVLWGRDDGAIAPRSHMLLKVDLDDGPAIVDVGFGGLTLTGALALTADITQATPHEPFRLLAVDDGYCVQAWVSDGWRSLYRFDLQPQHPIDYEAANWYLSTNPASRFVSHLVAARAAPDRRHALLDRDYAVHPLRGATERRTLATPAELMAVLEHEFLITLPQRDALQARVHRLFDGAPSA
jgi:N-hydroxyarylamine O-acetyltransferase